MLGNHDGYTGMELVAESLGRLAPQIVLLRRDLVRAPTGSPLYLAGIDDPTSRFTQRNLHLPELEELGARQPGDGPTILLVHRPEAFPQASRLGFPLVLAGHTHGGQLALPGAGHLNLARIVTRYHAFGCAADSRRMLRSAQARASNAPEMASTRNVPTR